MLTGSSTEMTALLTMIAASGVGMPVGNGLTVLASLTRAGPAHPWEPLQATSTRMEQRESIRTRATGFAG